MGDIGSILSLDDSFEGAHDRSGKLERLVDVLGRRSFDSGWPSRQFSALGSAPALNRPWSNLRDNAPGLRAILLAAAASPSPHATQAPQFILPTFPQYRPTPRPSPHRELPPLPTLPVLEPNPFYPDNMPTIQDTPIPWWLDRVGR